MTALDVLAPRARRVVLDVLACIIEADGEISSDEARAFRGACVALGMPEHTLATGTLDEVPVEELSPREAMLTFSAACWMVLADGVQLRAESIMLDALRHRLRLDGETARLLAAHARWIRASAETPWHREVDLLLTEAARKLDQIQARAACAA